MFGAKQRKIDELQGLVDAYGAALEEHHDCKVSCGDALTRSRRATTRAMGLVREADARTREAVRIADERAERIAELTKDPTAVGLGAEATS